MDSRVFNASISVGLLLVFGGIGMRFSWADACIVLGAILIVGTFTARQMAAPKGQD